MNTDWNNKDAHATVNLSRHFQPRVDLLASQSRGRGSWDCVRQMQMYRRRPDVLAAALRDMGFSESGDDIPDGETNENEELPLPHDNSQN